MRGGWEPGRLKEVGEDVQESWSHDSAHGTFS